jgi:hypothetical protein
MIVGSKLASIYRQRGRLGQSRPRWPGGDVVFAVDDVHPAGVRPVEVAHGFSFGELSDRFNRRVKRSPLQNPAGIVTA